MATPTCIGALRLQENRADDPLRTGDRRKRHQNQPYGVGIDLTSLGGNVSLVAHRVGWYRLLGSNEGPLDPQSRTIHWPPPTEPSNREQHRQTSLMDCGMRRDRPPTHGCVQNLLSLGLHSAIFEYTILHELTRSRLFQACWGPAWS